MGFLMYYLHVQLLLRISFLPQKAKQELHNQVALVCEETHVEKHERLFRNDLEKKTKLPRY